MKTRYVKILSWFLALFPHAKPLRTIAEKYFEEHPDAKDGVMKAWYAYHAPHFRVMPEMPLHNFTNSQRESKCVWCGRSREMVRHDEIDARCQNRPKEIKSIQDVLREEEEHAMALADRAKKDVIKLVSKMGMSGKTLAILHHTYGYEPETVSQFVDVPSELLSEYCSAMEIEKKRSKSSQNKIAITAK